MRTFKADPAALYFTDNGCVLCGEHLGMSAKYSGRDISGQPIQRVSLADVREYRLNAPDCPDIHCEQCGKELVGVEPRAALTLVRTRESGPDFRIANHGTVWIFTAISGEAKTFVSDQLALEAWQNVGPDGFAVDHRPAHTLAEQLVDEGFSCVEG